jgi:hypothetical protein
MASPSFVRPAATNRPMPPPLPRAARPAVVHWSSVGTTSLVCALVIFSLVACLPGRAESPSEQEVVASLELAPEPAQQTEAPAPASDPGLQLAESKPLLVNATPAKKSQPAPVAVVEAIDVQLRNDLFQRLAALEAAKTFTPPPDDRRFGTAVAFVSNPELAADQAEKEKKLLFLLHVSGNFEKSCFT